MYFLSDPITEYEVQNGELLGCLTHLDSCQDLSGLLNYLPLIGKDAL